MKKTFPLPLIFFTLLSATESFAAVTSRFDHRLVISVGDKPSKVSGDLVCLEFAKTFVPNDENLGRLATEVSTCAVIDKPISGENAICLKPFLMTGIIDPDTSRFSISTHTSPDSDPQDRIIVKVRNGQVGSSDGTFEIRVVERSAWRESIRKEKASVNAPYLCSVTFPARLSY